MRLTLAAFLLALIVTAAATLWVVGKVAEGAATAEATRQVKVTGATQGEKYTSPKVSSGVGVSRLHIGLLAAGTVCVAGLVAAVYGFTTKATERGGLAGGVAALKASLYVAVGGALLGTSIILYGLLARRILLGLLGGLIVAMNLYVVWRARSGARALLKMLEGAA